MLQKHLSHQISGHFDHVLTASQEQLIDGLSEFIIHERENSTCLIKGFAGTGKTSIMKALVAVLKEYDFPVRLMAPTGRAAKVLSSYVGLPAHTIHRTIYRQKQAGGHIHFDLNFNKWQKAYFIVDEASMIAAQQWEHSFFGTGNLLEDLVQYVFQGTRAKLILIGDTAQLPPVGAQASPALEKMELEALGLNVTEYLLTDVVRQEEAGGILYNATQLRQYIKSHVDSFEPFKLPTFTLSNYPDIHRISGEELIEKLSWCQENYGLDETIVVCRSNKRANLYNKGIRNSILFREEEITPGDYLMVVKNNYHWLKDSKITDFIANGDIAEIIRIHGYETLYDKRFARVTLRLVDYDELELESNILLNTLDSDTPGLSVTDQEQFYNIVMEDYLELPSQGKRIEELRKNPWFNALQVKFAYALTCHKAQGGQWKAVFVDVGYVPDEQVDVGYYRWLYTAFTRATEQLYLVNFKDDYFEENMSD